MDPDQTAPLIWVYTVCQKGFLNISTGEKQTAFAVIGALKVNYIYFIAPVASILINRLGCRFTATLGSVVYCVGLIASSLTPNFIFLYFSFGIVSGKLHIYNREGGYKSFYAHVNLAWNLSCSKMLQCQQF